MIISIETFFRFCFYFYNMFLGYYANTNAPAPLARLAKPVVT